MADVCAQTVGEQSVGFVVEAEHERGERNLAVYLLVVHVGKGGAAVAYGQKHVTGATVIALVYLACYGQHVRDGVHQAVSVVVTKAFEP